MSALQSKSRPHPQRVSHILEAMIYPTHSVRLPCYPSHSLYLESPYSQLSLTDLSVQYDPLVQPALLRDEIRASPASHATIAAARFTAARIIAGQDDRVLVIVGPCSIHAPDQALAYAKLLKEKMGGWNNLCVVMRSYL